MMDFPSGLKNTKSAVQADWHKTPEGQTVLQNICNMQSSTYKKLSGILERPIVPSHVNNVSYKIFFTGKSGSGKTTVIMRLAGIPTTSCISTHGIHKTDIYWPTKIWDKIVMFRLQCWEAGDNTLKKYSHVSPACREKADAIVFVFSYADQNSLLEISQGIPKLTQKNLDHPAVIIIGMRHSAKNSETFSNEKKQFESRWGPHILKMPEISEHGKLDEIVPSMLNSICERLWNRDQEYIMKQAFDKVSI